MKWLVLMLILLAGCVERVPEISEDCPAQLTSQQTEGPYYKANSPQKKDLREPGIPGEKMILEGYVFDENCEPIPNAWLDFWQTDGEGKYDNEGYKLRGHQFTDQNGKFTVTTVYPEEYGERTNHIHVKIKGEGEIVTSQIYFPNSKLNAQDTIYVRTMLAQMEGDTARINFRINR